MCRDTTDLGNFDLKDLDPDICREMVKFYNESNQQLYSLLRETKLYAPIQQPDFVEFEVLCWGYMA